MANTTLDEVEGFLKEFKLKLNFFSIVYEDRGKNKQTLLNLEITKPERTQFLEKLKPENYHTGPKKDTNDVGSKDYWEFGMIIKKKEVYIKIKIGDENKPVICISFHEADHKISYPFLKKKE